MSEYKTGRPLQELRLKDWDAGRLNVLRLAVQRLESEVNRTLSQSTKQSERRVVSDQVPFILDLAVNPGLRQVTISFSKPPGLGGHPFRQLLFYEIQHDTDSAFSNPTTLKTPYKNLSIGGFSLGETRSFRARVVNTLQYASVWSSTVTVTVAQSPIQLTAFPEFTKRLTRVIGDWEEVGSTTFQPVDAKSCLNMQIALGCPHFDTDEKDASTTRRTFHGGPAYVQFRVRLGSLNSATQDYDLREFGQRAILSARPGYSTSSSDKSSVRNPLAFGSFTTPFVTLTPGVSAKIVVEAAKMPGSEWLGPEKERAVAISDPIAFLRNGQIIEVLENL